MYVREECKSFSKASYMNGFTVHGIHNRILLPISIFYLQTIFFSYTQGPAEVSWVRNLFDYKFEIYNI